MHNLCVDLHSELTYFPVLWSFLKQFELLLANRGRRERFYVTCVKGTPGESLWQALPESPGRLYAERWNSAYNFIKVFEEFVAVLSLCWDASKYNSTERAAHQDEDATASAFSPARVTESLRTPSSTRT